MHTIYASLIRLIEILYKISDETFVIFCINSITLEKNNFLLNVYIFFSLSQNLKIHLFLFSQNVVTIDPPSKCCTLECPATGTGNGKVYQFDAAFNPEATTESVYDNVGSVIVEAVLDGYNGTVFAYGQTGCGKSHTMRGFIERTLDHIFEATSTASAEMRYLALLSYLEIYNERLRDLLQDGMSNMLTLKEDPNRGTYVAGGLKEVTVKDAAECARLVEQGDRRRAAAATKMNAASSRSHAVLTLSLETLAINEEDSKAENTVKRGRLHLVDLAGSERQARTGATGDRLKEAASINLSLSALGNVISALAAGHGRHVPYRYMLKSCYKLEYKIEIVIK